MCQVFKLTYEVVEHVVKYCSSTYNLNCNTFSWIFEIQNTNTCM